MKIRIPSPAMTVALIALLVATTGTAVAGVMITGANVKNSTLTGIDVKNNTLSGLDVKNGTVTTLDVRNGTLLPVDFKGGLPAGQQGLPGAQGAVGATGATGAQGLPGVSGYLRKFVITGPFNSTSPKTGEASCPAGQKLLSGGGRLHHLQAVPPPIAIQESYAADEDTWRVIGAEMSPTAASWEPVVVITCGTVT
jgi:hypothetical protein